MTGGRERYVLRSPDPAAPPTTRDWLEAALSRARRDGKTDIAAALEIFIRQLFDDEHRRTAA